jgi:hypothetical protein
LIKKSCARYRTKQRLRRWSLEPEAWRPSLRGGSTFLAEAEYTAVRRELYDILSKYRRDILDPSQRPEVRLFFAVSAAPPAAEED